MKGPGPSDLVRACDAIVSLPKSLLTDSVASLRPARLRFLDQALRVALALT